MHFVTFSLFWLTAICTVRSCLPCFRIFALADDKRADFIFLFDFADDSENDILNSDMCHFLPPQRPKIPVVPFDSYAQSTMTSSGADLAQNIQH